MFDDSDDDRDRRDRRDRDSDRDRRDRDRRDQVQSDCLGKCAPEVHPKQLASKLL